MQGPRCLHANFAAGRSKQSAQTVDRLLRRVPACSCPYGLAHCIKIRSLCVSGSTCPLQERTLLQATLPPVCVASPVPGFLQSVKRVCPPVRGQLSPLLPGASLQAHSLQPQPLSPFCSAGLPPSPSPAGGRSPDVSKSSHASQVCWCFAAAAGFWGSCLTRRSSVPCILTVRPQAFPLLTNHPNPARPCLQLLQALS